MARATVVSDNAVRSPVSGRAAAIVHLELFREAGPSGPARLGEMTLGDVVSLSVDGEAAPVLIVARRATLRFATGRPDPAPLDVLPPELAPLALASGAPPGGGRLLLREHLLRTGDRVVLVARLERDGASLVVRDDLAPVFLDEVVAGLDG